MNNLTLLPAYGRDYTSRAKVLADWNAEKDFIIADISSRYDGKPVNKQQLAKGTRVQFRYARNLKTFVLSV